MRFQLAVQLVFSTLLSAQIAITTVAGGGTLMRATPTSLPALNASFRSLEGLALDSAGNLYASDAASQQVVKISPQGALSIMAGNTLAGFTGDDGPAVNASLRAPAGLAVDSGGNLYIADQGNNRVRKVSRDGVITTVVGNGNRTRSGDGGPALAAGLSQPGALAFDSFGNLYIGENGAVRKVSSGGTISTVATVSGGIDVNPMGIALDSKGNLYIADNSANLIRKVDTAGTITTVAGGGGFSSLGDGGPATSAGILYPWGVVVDASGNIYFSEPRRIFQLGKIPNAANQRIRKVSPDGIITTLAGNDTPFFPYSCGSSGDGGPAFQAGLCNPHGLVVDSAGNIYVADSGNRRVRQINPAGIINTIAGGGSQSLSGQVLDPLGDIGAPATSAVLSTPNAVAADAAGSFYVADTYNHRVLKVDSSGITRLVAGNGVAGYSGEEKPATQAALNQPGGVAVDRLGNLYIADSGNGVIRKVTPAGIITPLLNIGALTSPALVFSSTTIGMVADAAGNLFVSDRVNQQVLKVDSAGRVTPYAGTKGAFAFGFSGDGGPATSAMLSAPVGLALDAVGNLYIADSHNNRIRKVGTDGKISTVAGSGPGFSPNELSCFPGVGDGGPATSASLCGPEGVAVDGAGNLYIAEAYFHGGIRKVAADGTLTTVTNRCTDFSGQNCFGGDGGSAASAVFSQVESLAFDADGNLLVADAGNNRIRKLLFVPPALTVSRSQLDFSAIQGGRMPTDRRVQVASSIASLAWTVAADNTAWLSLDPSSGATPGTLTVHVNATNLAAGTYQSTIRVRASLASPPEVAIPVTLTVQASQPPRLVVEPSAFLFQSPGPNASPSGQTLMVANAGSGQMSWTASAATANGGAWLTVTPASGTTTGAQPQAALIQVKASGLQPGVYQGTVTVAGGDGTILTIGVSHVVRDDTLFLEPTHTALQFTVVQGSDRPLQQCFGLILRASASGIVGLTSQQETLSGGNWLDTSDGVGGECREAGGGLGVLAFNVKVNPAGLSTGQYSGLIRLHANNQQTALVTVRLQVLPVGSNPLVQIQPAGMVFASQVGGTSPPSQTLRLSLAGRDSVGITTTLQTSPASGWLTPLAPSIGLLPGDPVFAVVQPQLGTLTSGQYRGFYNLQFSDGSQRNLDVLYLVVPAVCQPQQLLLMHRSLSAGFVVRTGQPVAVELQLSHECGNVVKDGTLVASFSNGDPPLILTNVGNGLYTGVWVPLHAGAAMTVTVRASHAQLAATEAPVDGRVDTDPAATLLFPGGAVSGADFAVGAALAPGGIVSVFGQNLSSTTVSATSLPLPRSLSGSTLNIGGIDAPLFYMSSGQSNAEVPAELTANRKHPVVVKAGTMVTVPDSVVVAPARPAIFTVSQDGRGQGAVLNAQGVLVDARTPAAVGDVVAVFCSGLGVTQPAVASGQPAPGAEPLARVVLPVTATIGGVPASVSFAGLAPGFAGLYQVNLQIPLGVAPSAGVPLVIVEGGITSNTVTLAVK